MGKAPTHCSPGCFDREGRECGPGDRKVQLPGTKVCQTHACPPDRKGWSLLLFCPAQLLCHRKQCLSLSGPLWEMGCRRLCLWDGMVWELQSVEGDAPGLSLRGPSYTTHSIVPLHSRYYTQGTSSLVSHIHTIRLTARTQSYVHAHCRSHSTALLFHDQCLQSNYCTVCINLLTSFSQ